MRKYGWQIGLGLVLVALSALLYYVHYLIFRDARHIFIYLVGDLAFVPIEVLLVTLIIHRLLAAREKRSMMNKMNMAIGTFFQAVGTRLLEMLVQFDAESDGIRSRLLVTGDWTDQRFGELSQHLARHEPRIDPARGDLTSLRTLLAEQRDFLLGLLQNPNLLEHESFSDLLWAVFHLADELCHRRDLSRLPRSDLDHLAGDIRRAYSHLVRQWASYMAHLKKDYPYLFSLAVRTNPFNPDANPLVT